MIYIKLPLILRIKKERHKEIAKAQDILVETLYPVFDKAVLHGDTAIWRCYSGKRFSEDIDVYIPKDTEKINSYFAKLKERGIELKKKKITENSLYSELLFSGVSVRFEASFRQIDGILSEYEGADGNLITVFTLSPEALIKEKVSAYLGRRKIRDLYDIFFLAMISDKAAIKKDLTHLVFAFKPPLDEDELKVLILEGIVPDYKKMLEYLRRQA